MLELQTDAFNLYLLGVHDEEDLAAAGRVDVLLELPSGERFAGTARSLADLDASLSGVYLPVTDTVVVRDLTPDAIVTAVADLLSGGVLDEVFLEVLEEVEG